MSEEDAAGRKEVQIDKRTDETTGAVYYHVDFKDLFILTPFKPVQKIGQGASGQVLLLHNEINGHIVAAKIFSFQENDKKDRRWRHFRREVAIMQELKHENIVSVVCGLACPAYGLVIMDYYMEGSLSQKLAGLPGELVHSFFVQISCAVRYLHSKRIVHRDIKSSNVLVSRNSAHLTDFGCSSKVSEEICPIVNGRTGTRRCMAPEVSKACNDTLYDGFKADSFATGVILWSMVLRREPSVDMSLLETFEAHEHVDPFAWTSVRRLLQPDPKTRWCITRLLEELVHTGYPLAWQIEKL